MLESILYLIGMFLTGVFTGVYYYRKYKDAIELFINRFKKH